MSSLREIILTLGEIKEKLNTDYGVQRIGVFGSYARNTQTSSSDIDFIVEFSRDVPDLFETKYQLRRYLSATFGRQIDLANLEAIKPYVLAEISQEIVYV